MKKFLVLLMLTMTLTTDITINGTDTNADCVVFVSETTQENPPSAPVPLSDVVFTDENSYQLIIKCQHQHPATIQDVLRILRVLSNTD